MLLDQIGKILVDTGKISGEKLEAAVKDCGINGSRLGEYLAQHGYISEDDIYNALSDQFAMEYIESISAEVSRDIIDMVPFELIQEGRAVPLEADEDIIKIALCDPLDIEAEMLVSRKSGRMVKTVLALPSVIKKASEDITGSDSFFKKSVHNITKEFQKSDNFAVHEDISESELRKNSELKPVVKMADVMLEEAVAKGASDIHIEPSEDDAAIRFRIDGMLTEYIRIDKWFYVPLASRVKIMARLDIAEKRAPQDGRIRINIKSAQYDLRVSTLCTHYGEKVVIRILKHDTRLLDIEQLGMPEKEINELLYLVEKPQGMLFVTGPTGSGKSTTLFACLNRIKSKEINITTIENPVEYKLPGINQTQVNEKAGVTFAGTLRSILRQDPDVILVGETRDLETAQIAVQSSQTGHLVFSTLHTNDSFSAITRLRDLGIPSFLISSSLIGILAQRLVRRLCPFCKEKHKITESLKKRWERAAGEIPFSEAYYPAGCKKCGGKGYLGREGIFELIFVNEEVRRSIAADGGEEDMREKLRESGMRTMLDNSIVKIIEGKTSPDEVMRTIMVESAKG